MTRAFLQIHTHVMPTKVKCCFDYSTGKKDAPMEGRGPGGCGVGALAPPSCPIVEQATRGTGGQHEGGASAPTPHPPGPRPYFIGISGMVTLSGLASN